MILDTNGLSAEAQTASQAVVPVIEIGPSMAQRMDGEVTAQDIVAANCGCTSRILVGEGHHPDQIDLGDLPISLEVDGKNLRKANAETTKDNQWANLMTLINQIVAEGRVLHEGDMILSGSIGPGHPAGAGRYLAHCGPLGGIEFELK